jgi:hypothetical protein
MCSRQRICDGDAGDPVLAVDQTSNIVYLAGTSMRDNAGNNGIPIWKSTDGGVTFGNPVNVHEEITCTDKEWIAVDNANGTGQHDLYLTFGKLLCTPAALFLTVATNGDLDSWSDRPAGRFEYGCGVGDSGPRP